MGSFEGSFNYTLRLLENKRLSSWGPRYLFIRGKSQVAGYHEGLWACRFGGANLGMGQIYPSSHHSRGALREPAEPLPSHGLGATEAKAQSWIWKAQLIFPKFTFLGLNHRGAERCQGRK